MLRKTEASRDRSKTLQTKHILQECDNDPVLSNIEYACQSGPEGPTELTRLFRGSFQVQDQPGERNPIQQIPLNPHKDI